MRRGEIWLADLPSPAGSEAGFRRPVVIVQDDLLNMSKVRTVVIVPITSNLKYAVPATSVLLPANRCPLKSDSVAVTHLVVAVDRSQIEQKLGVLPTEIMEQVDIALLKCIGLFC